MCQAMCSKGSVRSKRGFRDPIKTYRNVTRCFTGVLEAFNEQNPGKGGVWYDKATDVRRTTERLYQLIDSLKLAIAVRADGKEADVKNILNQDDLEAASVVMLGAVSPQGAHLKKEVQGYSDYIASFMTDSVKSDNIRKALSTADVTRKGTVIPVSWEEAMFDSKPVVAAITLLTKLAERRALRRGRGSRHPALQRRCGRCARQRAERICPSRSHAT